jgi:BRO1-like domain
VIDITFTWTDSFTSRKCSVPSIIYEKAAVLFNIAALYTKIAYNASNVLSVPLPNGKVENTTEECVVQAIDALRNAALYFSQLANEYSTRLLPMKVTGDLSSQALKTVTLLLSVDPVAEGRLHRAGTANVLCEGNRAKPFLRSLAFPSQGGKR